MGVYSVKYSCDKSFEDKNNSNEIILIGFLLKVNKYSPFFDVLNGVV